MNNFYYISHGGPGSGRYPLGSGERPYQKFEGSRRRGSGGIVGYIKERRQKKAEEKAQKALNEETKKRIEKEKERERMEADKERVLRSGSASEVMKYQGRLTNQELSYAAERLRLENQLNSYSKSEVNSAYDKLKTLQSYTNVSSALARDGIDLWNSFASVYNAIDEGKKRPLTLVSKGGGGDNKKKDK